jgi:hypothetical protein
MEQKTIWTRFLITGISIITLALLELCSCKRVDYKVSADWVYINNTEYQIETGLFVLSPKETVSFQQSSEGPKEIHAEDYVPITYDSPIIIYNGDKCDTLNYGDKAGKGEGILGTQNYQYEKIGERYYKFIYTFTEDDYLKAEDCGN